MKMVSSNHNLCLEFAVQTSLDQHAFPAPFLSFSHLHYLLIQLLTPILYLLLSNCFYCCTWCVRHWPWILFSRNNGVIKNNKNNYPSKNSATQTESLKPIVPNRSPLSPENNKIILTLIQYQNKWSIWNLFWHVKSTSWCRWCSDIIVPPALECWHPVCCPGILQNSSPELTVSCKTKNALP